MASFTVNGTDIGSYTSDVAETIAEVAVVAQMANGRTRKAHRAMKRRWDITCNRITGTQRAAVQAIAVVTTTFTVIDQHGVSRTAMVEPGSYKTAVTIISPTSDPVNPTLYYDVQIALVEE